jgi:DNA-binding CsgD family transcriptional regulator
MQTTRPGLILVDTCLNLIAGNEEALQILTFRDHLDKVRRSWAPLKEQIRSGFGGHSGTGSGFLREFRSGKRTYLCYSFPLSTVIKNGASSPARVLVFERRRNSSMMTSEACGRFGLTQREQEVTQLLVQGLTSKEIAERMRISPNTVKSFIRLVMVKMGVPTRAAIVVKVLGSGFDRPQRWSVDLEWPV